MKLLISASLASVAAAASVPTWGQCGGQGYTGSTVCATGSTCVYSNQWYSQCQPGGSTTLVTSASSTKTSSPTSSSSSPPASSSGSPRLVGRVNPATRELTWPGSGISFTFTGTTATIAVASVSGSNSADLIVDGGSPIVISNVQGSISTPSGLAKGTHTVTLRKRSETALGSIFLGSVTADGPVTSDKAPTRQIEIVGDSISVGYGLDGTYPCTNTAALEDAPMTYAALAANQLGADYSDISWSGKGIVRNYESNPPDTSPLMPELWTRYGANDADNSYTFPAAWNPQAVIIALGTNDFGYLNVRDPLNITQYTAALVSFSKTVQSHYHGANVFFISSPMLSDSYPTTADAQHTTQSNAMKAAASQIGSTAHFVDWPTQGSTVGCDYHPTGATHAAEAPVLASALSSALGW